MPITSRHPSTSRPDAATPLACRPEAIAPADRAAHLARADYLLTRAAREVRDLPDGYAICFDADQYERVAEFIAHERRCCPFLTFTLEVGADAGPLWLRLTGPAKVKAFLRAVLPADGAGHSGPTAVRPERRAR